MASRATTEYYTISNLINLIFRPERKPQSFPRASQILSIQLQRMQASQANRDLTFITAEGVEFAVHSQLLIGASSVLNEYLWPGGVTKPNRPTAIKLPPTYEPAFIDRLVQHLYSGTYTLDQGGKALYVYQATKIPNPEHGAYAIHDLPAPRIHIKMYAMGEQFGNPGLQATAFTKLANHLLKVRNSSIEEMAGLIAEAYDKTYCKDEDGRLKGLMVAAVLAHEYKCWTAESHAGFLERVKDISAFLDAYFKAKQDFADVLVIPEGVRAREKKRRQGEHK